MLKSFDIMNHPSNWIYRLITDDNLTILKCVGEYSEVIDNIFDGNKCKGWQVVKDAKILASVYKYIIQNNLDFDHVYMLDI